MVKDILSAVGWTTATLIFDDVIDLLQRYELRRLLQQQQINTRVFSLAMTSGNYLREIDLLSDGYLWIVISDVTSQEALRSLKADVHANVVFVTEKWSGCMEESWRERVETSHVMTRDSITRQFSIDLSEEHTTPMEYEIASSSDRSGDVTVVHSGNWSEAHGLVTDKRNLFLNTFYDFGKTILVASLETAPFVMKVLKGNRHSYVGFCIDILDELADRMGFNYTIVEPMDTFYGAPIGNGSWNGMIGMVQRGEAEMAIGPFTITSLREQVIDFTVPFSEGSTGIMTLSPGYQAKKSLFQTLKPYSAQVWISVLCSVFLVGFVSLLVNRYTPFQMTPEARPFQQKYESSLEDNMWMVYSSVTEQGIQHSPRAVSGRCLIGFWWLFTILLVATYTANLAAFLTISLPPPPINNMGELVAQDAMLPFIEAGSSFETFFKESRTELYQKAWSRMKEAPRVSLEEEVLNLIRTGKYAYVGDKPVLDSLSSESCFTFSVAAESFDFVGYGFVLSEGAAYAHIVNPFIHQMQEAGLVEKWRKKWWGQPSHCLHPHDDKVNSLGLDSLGGLFLSYAGIIALASGCLVLKIAFQTLGHRTRVECDAEIS
ncbi:glutamate receptor ionotropic, kainate 4-like [Liolophura sinensis]|uniref:glutamate receptor ionotropic, kainate 4-like n=1 Tax=Liolophura sinensis TaxID=3198878 RepID=UPI003157F44E